MHGEDNGEVEAMQSGLVAHRAATTTFGLVKSLLGPATGILTVGTMLLWLRLALSRRGSALVWAKADTLAVAA
ncbi:hypothetical protein [Ilumatobacter sp.]|uniref:hypothetical protein n=1 Tax=Ilumatobacter sp. TaxID=1967498 RepID=UPI0037537A58